MSKYVVINKLLDVQRDLTSRLISDLGEYYFIDVDLTRGQHLAQRLVDRAYNPVIMCDSVAKVMDYLLHKHLCFLVWIANVKPNTRMLQVCDKGDTKNFALGFNVEINKDRIFKLKVRTFVKNHQDRFTNKGTEVLRVKLI